MPKQFDNTQLLKQIQEDMKNITHPAINLKRSNMTLRCGHINCGAIIGEINFPVLAIHITAKCPECGCVNEVKSNYESKCGMKIDWN